MAKHFLKMPDGCAVFKHVGGAGMAERMDGDVLPESGQVGAMLDILPNGMGFDLPALVV